MGSRTRTARAARTMRTASSVGAKAASKTSAGSRTNKALSSSTVSIKAADVLASLDALRDAVFVACEKACKTIADEAVENIKVILGASATTTTTTTTTTTERKWHRGDEWCCVCEGPAPPKRMHQCKHCHEMFCSEDREECGAQCRVCEDHFCVHCASTKDRLLVCNDCDESDIPEDRW